MATNWLQTGTASSSPNVGDQGEGGVKRSATGEKVVPNVEALVDAGGMRGREKPVVEGLEDQMEAVLLRLLSKHGLCLRAAGPTESTGAPTTSSSTSKMVEQGCQTELVGDVIPVSKRARNKVSFAAESGDLLTGEAEETAPVAATKSSILVAGDAEGVVPVAMVMSEGEILELEAARIQQESDEDLYADGGGKLSQAADLPIIDCDGKTWERHFHEDGREYLYCLDTGDTQWVLPKKTGIAGNSEGSGVGMDIVPGEEEPALGTTSSSSPTESFRAQQGSLESVNSGVNSVGEKDFSSTIRDSGLRAGGDAPTSGSPDEEGISGIRADIAGEHLDREEMEALSEGVAAVESVGPEEKMPNVEIGTVSAAEERVVDVVPVVQEGDPGDLEDGGKKLCVTTEEVSSFGAKNLAIQGKKEASGIAGDTGDLKDEAWSANDARVNVPDSTWSAKEARVEAHMVSRSADDCNNGAQVSVAADDGGSQVDALVQPEVSSEERNSKGYTGANVAAVVNDGGNSPLETMEPKEPAVEENVPAADEQSNSPAVEENLPAAEGVTKDSNDGSTPTEGEVLPSESSPEVDTERTATDEAKPLAGKKEGPEPLEHKMDDLVGLVQEQDKQLDPKVETKDVPGADDTEMVSEEHAKIGPIGGALVTPGEHCYQAGDWITALVRCINGHGALLEHGDLNVLTPDEGKNTPSFKIGDTVSTTVRRVDDDGTVILDSCLVFEEDDEDSSPAQRKWKVGGWDAWWGNSWCDGQWYQDSNGHWDWKWEEEQSDEWFADQVLSSEEQEERQLYGEKIYRTLLEDGKADKAYVGKITGMLLSRTMDEILECVADHAFLDAEARRAYGILQSDGWKPDGAEGAGLGKTTAFSRKQYHNVLYELACKKRRFSRPVVGEAVATLLSQGKDELWNALWLDTKRFLQELDGAIESMSKRENKPMEAYMDPDQYKKAHLTPKTVSPGYSKLCKFFNQGRCRNGDECSYEHRRYGEGWPGGGPTEPKNSQKAGDEDGDNGGPPTEEGTVDEAQQEREDSAFRAKYNFGKGASKGESVSVEPKRQMCLCYNQGGCKYGNSCRYSHDEKAVLEGTWEPGRSWDNASRKALREAGFHHCCFDYYIKGRCRVRYGCKYSHEEMSEERLAQLKHLVNVANHVSFQRGRGLEISTTGKWGSGIFIIFGTTGVANDQCVKENRRG